MLREFNRETDRDRLRERMHEIQEEILRLDVSGRNIQTLRRLARRLRRRVRRVCTPTHTYLLCQIEMHAARMEARYLIAQYAC